MPSGKKLGTLVVVVLKARHLKDKHTFYKQDPYAVVRLGGTERQTNVDPKGGQHPVWDTELHLPVLEVMPGSDGRILSVSAYSKENKIDELLGEGKVDVSDTLVTGEFDDWIKLELNGAYRGEIYLEMTYYAAEPPLLRRPSKLAPKDRLWRPPATPPKETTSPYHSPQRSPQTRPTTSVTNSPHLPPSLSPHYNFDFPPPSTSSPRRDESRLQDISIPVPSPSRQPSVDPTLKNIPFLDVGPSASDSGAFYLAPPPKTTLHSVPSILRPRNARSSPIPVPARDNSAPIRQPENDLNGANRWFQRELAESDAAFAARLAQSEGIDIERLRREEADAALARRLAFEDEEGGMGSEAPIPGGWVG